MRIARVSWGGTTITKKWVCSPALNTPTKIRSIRKHAMRIIHPDKAESDATPYRKIVAEEAAKALNNAFEEWERKNRSL